MYNLNTLEKNEIQRITDPLKNASNKFSQLKLNENRLKMLSQGSKTIGEFQEFLQFHNREKGFFDNLPFIGAVLKNNRYANYSIDKAVEKFAEHIKVIKDSVDNTLDWLEKSEENSYQMLEEFKKELEKIKQTIKTNDESNMSKINTLRSTPYRTPEQTRELRKLEQNLIILKGEAASVETAYNAMTAKLALLNSSIDSTIRIQGKAAQAESLPIVLRVALETIQTNQTLQSAMGGLKDTESIVRHLMSDAVQSTNATSAEAQKLQQQAMQFKECISALNEIKEDCEDIALKLS